MKKRHIVLMVFFFASWIFLSMTAGVKSGSTFASEAQGAKAFYLLLEAEGLAPTRFFYPFSELKTQGLKGVLFVISPESVGAEKELKEWVTAGNTLVLLSSPGGRTYDLFQELGLTSKQMVADFASEGTFWSEPESIAVDCKSEECTGVKAISRPERKMVSATDADVMAGPPGEARVLRRRLGSGEVWAFSGSEPVWNQNIDRFDNLRLLYQLAGTKSNIYFDEFHHGYLAPVTPKNAAGFHAIILALAYLALVALVSALSRSVRFGPPALEGPQESLASTDFAGVLGLLYAERGARSALRHYVGAWRGRIEKRFSISRRLPHEAMLSDLAHEGIIDPERVNRLSRELRTLEQPNSEHHERLEHAVSELEKLATDQWRQAALTQERHQ